MTYVLRFLPEVEEDAITAFAWYQEKAQRLGDDLPIEEIDKQSMALRMKPGEHGA